jgi:hypothetical protein
LGVWGAPVGAILTREKATVKKKRANLCPTLSGTAICCGSSAQAMFIGTYLAPALTAESLMPPARLAETP